MTCTCRACGTAFDVTPDDLAFYEKVSPVFGGKRFDIPPPSCCPDCRFQRRLAIRNERSLHHRKSDLTGKQIVAMYSPDKPYKVYDQDEWWSDEWDPLAYGRDFDFSRPFFEQFDELYHTVPHPSLYTTNVTNCYFTNYVLHSKNCYLIYGGGHDEDCLYGRFVVHCSDTIDGLSLYSCKWCYEGIASEDCYECLYFQNCRNCVNCAMIEDCNSCTNCICCFSLAKKEYCILNEQLTKAEYERRKAELFPLTHSNIDALRKRLHQLKAKSPHRSSHIFSSEDCTGDMISTSKHCFHSFDVTDCEESKYLCYTPKGIHSHDCTYNAPDGVEWCYENCSTVGARSCLFCFLLRYCSDLLYCIECIESKNLFGCVGLRRKQYCILNKQYTKQEYETLVPKIIEHMQRSNEWGAFFPITLSPYGYNETTAQELFPRTKEDVLEKGWKWYGELQVRSYMGPTTSAPKSITEVQDDICEKILTCEATQKPFKIIPQELQFYRKMGLPIPRLCPDERHRRRMERRNPRKLWQRPCGKCQKAMQTTYSPERQEIVYCEECYRKQVY